MSKKRVVVAVSGQGSLLAAILAYQSQHFEVVGVITSDYECLAAKNARALNIRLFYDPFRTKEIPSLRDWLLNLNADFIVLAGFIRKFPCFDEFEQKIINCHPALLPKFGGKGMYGLKVHEAVLAHKEPLTGSTIHYVSEEYDKGRIIAQSHIGVKADDDPNTLAQRVQSIEKKMLPWVIDGLIIGSLPQNDIVIYHQG